MADHEDLRSKSSPAKSESASFQETNASSPAEEGNDKKDKSLLSRMAHQQSSPVSLVAPEAGVKIPDRADMFSRPRGFDERFVVMQRWNAQDLYRSYNDKRPAIEDRGDSLRTKNADRATAMDMIEVAAHRGWSKMNVKGPEAFRREMWIEGTVQGMKVLGYRPSEKDKSEVERRAELVGYRVIERADGHPQTQTGGSQNAVVGKHGSDKSTVVELPNYEKGVRGKIAEIGIAPYHDREGASRTPYIAVELTTNGLANGRIHKIWGAGLPAMIADKKLQVGDTATITSTGKKTITVDMRDEKTGQTKPVTVYRREWTATDVDKAQIKKKIDRVTETSERRTPQDRATDLEHRIKSPQAARDPVVRGAASKLSLMEAELNAQGVARKDIDMSVSNALTQLSKALASGKKVPVEKLANVTRGQEDKARDRAGSGRTRTIERDKNERPARAPRR